MGAPPAVADLATAACQFVERAVGVGVDFTPETLPIVDHYVTLVRQEVQDRPQLVPLVTRALGAYFGQVVVRELNGFWQVPSDDDRRWLVCLRHVLLAFNPVGVVYEVLLPGSTDGPAATVLLAREEREVVVSRLAALPEVGEAEYYMLATRLEGLQIAALALTGLRDAATADVEFDADDYRTLVADDA